MIRWDISRLRRCAKIDWGAALGEREEVRKGIEGYGRERRKLFMLNDAEIRAKGWSLENERLVNILLKEELFKERLS